MRVPSGIVSKGVATTGGTDELEFGCVGGIQGVHVGDRFLASLNHQVHRGDSRAPTCNLLEFGARYRHFLGCVKYLDEKETSGAPSCVETVVLGGPGRVQLGATVCTHGGIKWGVSMSVEPGKGGGVLQGVKYGMMVEV